MRKRIPTSPVQGFSVALSIGLTGCLLCNAFPLASAQTAQSNKIAPKAEYRLKDQLVVGAEKLPYVITRSKIDFPRDVEAAEYLITPTDETPVSFPMDSRQRILRKEGTGIILKVERRLPVNPLAPFPAPVHSEGLGSTPLIDSDNWQLSQLAKDLVGQKKFTYDAAKTLRDWVERHIAESPFHSQSLAASQVLANREGDMTEKALLFAALCRAVGIPARMVGGLQYQAFHNTGIGGFHYHTWVEVLSGQEWVPLDPTQTSFLIDAAHIKVTHSHGASSDDVLQLKEQVTGLMNRISIEAMRAQAPGSTEVSLSGRISDTAIQIPKVDIATVDITKATQKSIKEYTFTPEETVRSKRTPAGRFTAAMEQLLEGDAERAEQGFISIGELLQTAPEWFALGQKLTAIEFYGLAARAFNEATHLEPAMQPAVLAIKKDFFPSYIPTEAGERAYTDAVATKMSGADGPLVESMFNAIIKENPGFADPYRHLGDLYLQKGELDLANKAYRTYITASPNDPRGYLGLGSVELAQKNYAGAAQHFILAKGKASAMGSQMAKPYIKEAEEQAALASAQSVLAKNPKSADGWLKYGHALMATGQTGEALQAYENVTFYSPNNRLGKLYQADVLVKEGEWEKANPILDELGSAGVSGGKNGATLNRILARKAMLMNSTSLAKQYLQRAIANEPGNPEHVVLLADVLKRMNQPRQAETILQQGAARMLNPVDQHALRHLLVDTLLENGQTLSAERELNALLKVDPGNSTSYRQLGQLALAKKELPAARSALSRAFLLNHQDPDILAAMGQLNEAENDVGEAVHYYQKALKLSPTHPVAATQLAALVDSNRFRIKKPEASIPLSPSEMDYLIGIFNLTMRDSGQVKATVDEINGLTAAYPKSVPSELLVRRKTADIFKKYYEGQQSRLKQLQSIKAPERFKQYHQITTLFYGERLKQTYYLLEILPQFPTPLVTQYYQPKLDPINSTLQQLQAAQNAAIEKASVTDAQWNVVAHEAGFQGTYADFQAQFATTVEELSAFLGTAGSGFLLGEIQAGPSKAEQDEDSDATSAGGKEPQTKEGASPATAGNGPQWEDLTPEQQEELVNAMQKIQQDNASKKK